MKALTALALLASAPAFADPTIVIDFDTIANNAYVNNFYAGGIDSLGASGSNLGVSFSDFVTASSPAASSGPRFAYSSVGHGLINVAAGFGALDFTYGTLAPATVSVWSGLDGSGSLLGSVVVNGHASAFAASSVEFAGVGRSITLVSLPSYAAIDDVRLSPVQAVPEPASALMLAAGLGVLLRRKRR